MEPTLIKVADSLLPEDDSKRADFLSQYFCELVASADKANGEWVINLRRPPTLDYYVDPRLEEGLHWWSTTFTAIDVQQIPFVFENSLGFQLSLHDSWTIYSWSKYFSGRNDTSGLPPEINLLHLDDHDDFMTPRLVLGPTADQWIDTITKRPVSLLDSASIKAAVESGAIGIGSFMAPLLFSIPRVHIRHLCSTEYTSKRIGIHKIKTKGVADELLAPQSLRPAIELEAINEENQNLPHDYLVTDDLPRWLDGLPDCPTLLHIDMDYFNNRFDGDSDRIRGTPKYDPPATQVFKRIDDVFAAIEESALASNIVDIAVALSPGFFPTDFWPESIDRVKHDSRILGSRSGDTSNS